MTGKCPEIKCSASMALHRGESHPTSFRVRLDPTVPGLGNRWLLPSEGSDPVAECVVTGFHSGAGWRLLSPVHSCGWPGMPKLRNRLQKLIYNAFLLSSNGQAKPDCATMSGGLMPRICGGADCGIHLDSAIATTGMIHNFCRRAGVDHQLRVMKSR